MTVLADVIQALYNRRSSAQPDSDLFSTIGSFSLTAAESSVPIVDFTYWPGHLYRYGKNTSPGTTDMATALTRALTQASNSGGSPVFIPDATNLIGSQISIPQNVTIYGAGKHKSILLKGFNGDLFVLGSNSGFRDIQINGNASNFTGRSVLINASTFGQWFDNCQLTNSSGYHCEYLGQDPGSVSWFLSCDFDPTVVPANGVSVKYSATQDSAAVPRSIINCHGGGSYIVDFGGANDSFFIGNFTNGMIWSTSVSSHVFISSCRIALNGATLTVKGGDTCIQNCAIAGPIIFDNTTSGCSLTGISADVGWNSITDNGTGNYIDIKQVSYSPVWTTSGTAPSLGNGSLVGQFSRSGNLCTTDIDFQPGSTTTFGTGDFRFSLPFSPGGSQFTVGVSYLQHSGTTQVATVTSNPAVNYVTLNAHGSSANVSATVPWTWANGDRITLHVEYYLP